MKEATQGSSLLIYGVILMLLVFVARVQELFTFLVPLRMGKVSVFLAVLLFMLSAAPRMRVSLLQIPQTKIILAIFALALFSVPFSVWPGQSFAVATKGMFLLVLFFLLLVYSVNSFKDMRKMIWAFIAGTVLLAFFTIASRGGGLSRLAASRTYDPNDIAMLFVITLPLIYFFMGSRKGQAKLILFGSLLMVLFAFALTASRGGFLGLMVIGLFILFKDKQRSGMTKLLVLGLLFLAFLQFTPDTYWERMSTLLEYEEDYNIQSEQGRLTVWRRGLSLMVNHPLTGVGVGAFKTAMGHTYGQGVSGFKWSAAHNAFVQIGAELGLAGFILFIWLILSSLRMLRRLRAKYAGLSGEFADHLWLTTALEISLWGYVTTAMFLSAAYSSMFYFLIAMCGVFLKLDLMNQLQEQPVEPLPGKARR